LNDFPWYLIGIALIAIITFYTILTQENYAEAFNLIKNGVLVTITTSIIAYTIALIIGLLTSVGYISKNVIIRNIATFYVEIIRGIPMLVLIFYIALVGVPTILGNLNGLGDWVSTLGFTKAGESLSNLSVQDIPMNFRAIIALSVTYGAFLAEVFRAGIQSIPKGQMEAARSLGLSNGQAMRYVILPQAIRNVLPALGNDFVAMVKDSSLVSLLAVRDITQIARLYAGRSFRFQEAYTILASLYLSMTVSLSLIIKSIESRLRRNE
jgi:polar amino acid transport system permease protein